MAKRSVKINKTGILITVSPLGPEKLLPYKKISHLQLKTQKRPNKIITIH
jgi:hypothetical protein